MHENGMLTPEPNELYGKAIDTFGEAHQLTKHSSELAEYAGRISQLSCDKQREIDLNETLKEAAWEYVDAMIITHAQFIEILRRSGNLNQFMQYVSEYKPVALEKLRTELCNCNDV